jgi:hypothetical protein
MAANVKIAYSKQAKLGKRLISLFAQSQPSKTIQSNQSITSGDLSTTINDI